MGPYKTRKYTIIINEVETLLDNFPEGWKDSNVDYQYSETLRTVFRSFQSQSMTFYFEGGELLKGLFDTEGSEAVAYLLIEELQNDFQYKELDYGRFDFSTYNYSFKDDSVTINIDDSSDIVNFMNRKDFSVSMSKGTSIDGSSITAPSYNEVTLKKQDLVRKFEADLTINDAYENGISSTVTEPTNSDIYNEVDIELTNSFGLQVSNEEDRRLMYLYESAPFVSQIISESAIGYSDDIIKALAGTGYTSDECAGIARILSFNCTMDYTLLSTKTYQVTHAIWHSRLGVLWGKEDSIETFYSSPSIQEYAFDEIIGSAPLENIEMQQGDTLKLLSSFILISEDDALDPFTIVHEGQQWSVRIEMSAASGISVDKEYIPNTSELISNDFGSEINIPYTTSTVLYTHALPYSVESPIKLDDGNIIITPTGLGNNYDLTLVGRLVHKNGSGVEYANSADLYSGVASSMVDIPTVTIPISGIDETWTMQPDDTITFELTQVLEISQFNMMTLDIASSFGFRFEDSAPADSLIEGYSMCDVLRQCMSVIVGSGKLSIADDVENNDELIKSANGVMVMRGSMIRGVSASVLPMTCSFDDAFNSIANIIGLGLDYNRITGIFEIDYLENIYKKSSVSIYSIEGSDVNQSVATDLLYKGVKVGNSLESDLNSFYGSNEPHSETTYATQLTNVGGYLEIQNIISTDGTEMEIARRYSAVEDANFTRDNDNKLFMIKCTSTGVDTYQSQEEEMVTIVSSPLNFCKTNLVFCNRIVILNNLHLLLSAFYQRTGTLVFMESIYILADPVTLSFDYFNDGTTLITYEQSDIDVLTGLQEYGEALWLPLLYEFDGLMDADMIEQLKEDRHIVFETNDIEINIREAGLDSFDRKSTYKCIAYNPNR